MKETDITFINVFHIYLVTDTLSGFYILLVTLALRWHSNGVLIKVEQYGKLILGPFGTMETHIWARPVYNTQWKQGLKSFSGPQHRRINNILQIPVEHLCFMHDCTGIFLICQCQNLFLHQLSLFTVHLGAVDLESSICSIHVCKYWKQKGISVNKLISM